MNQPVQHLGRAVGGVADQLGGVGSKHSSERSIMRLAAVTSAWRIAVVRLDIDDDRVIDIDQVIGRIGEERLVRGAPRSIASPVRLVR